MPPVVKATTATAQRSFRQRAQALRAEPTTPTNRSAAMNASVTACSFGISSIHERTSLEVRSNSQNTIPPTAWSAMYPPNTCRLNAATCSSTVGASVAEAMDRR